MRRVRLAVAASLAVAVLAAAPATATDAPSTSGDSALVLDARSGTVMHAVKPDEPRAIASATKLMTALLTLERASLDDVFAAPAYHAAPVESKIGLRRGERMRVRDLLTALLLESANDAAVTLAVGVAGSRAAFVREMNRRAVELGLSATSYANPIGFDDPDNHSSARDLATLAARLLRNGEFARIVDLPRAVLRSGSRRRVIDNRNRLIARRPFVSGVKTGHTQRAGYVLVGSTRAKGVPLISVTLGAPSESARDADTLALLRWGLDQFRRVKVVKARRVLARVPIEYRDERAELGAARSLKLVLRRDERATTRLDAPGELTGPLPAGERVGWIEISQPGARARRLPLVTLEPVPGAGFLRKLTSGIGTPLTALIGLGMVVIATWLVMRRRR